MPSMDPKDAEEHFRKLVPERGDLLRRLEKDAASREIPIVGPSMGNFLYLMALISRSQKILELGTACGYSTIWLSKAARDLQGRIHTYEMDKGLAGEAEKNIKEAGYGDLVTVHQEDITEALPNLDDSFSLIFVDTDKDAYEKVLYDCVDLLKPRGLLIADNVAFEELKGFNKKLADVEMLDTAFIHGFWAEHTPELDGLAIARKRVA